jgi:hypothetical protein
MIYFLDLYYAILPTVPSILQYFITLTELRVVCKNLLNPPNLGNPIY